MLLQSLVLNGPNRPFPPFIMNSNSIQSKQLLLWYPGAPTDKGKVVPDYSGRRNDAVSASFDFGRTVRPDPEMGWSYELFQASSPFAWAPFSYTPTLSIKYTARKPMRYTHSCWVKVPSSIIAYYRTYNRLIGGITLSSNNWGGPGGAGRVGITFDKWTHLCLVQANNVQKFYVNGVQVSSVSYNPGTFSLAFTPFANYYFPFRGNLTDCRVYDIDLMPSEVCQLYSPTTRWELYKPAAIPLINPLELAKVQMKCSSSMSVSQGNYNVSALLSCRSTLFIPENAEATIGCVASVTAAGTLVYGYGRFSQTPIETVQTIEFPTSRASQVAVEYVGTFNAHARISQFVCEYIIRPQLLHAVCVSTLTADAFATGLPVVHLGCVSTLTAIGTTKTTADLFCHSTISANPTVFGQFHVQADLSCNVAMDALAADAKFVQADLQCVATMSPTAVVMFVHAQASLAAVATFGAGTNVFPTHPAAVISAVSNLLTADAFLVHYPKAMLLCQASMEGTVETFVDPTVLPPMDLIAQSSRQTKLPAASSAVTELPASSR